MAEVRIIGLRELQLAVRRNPNKVQNEAKAFLSRGLAEYKRGIIRSPWGISSGGGGVPVSTGNLRDQHMTRINGLQGTIGPNPNVTTYARYVHGGTRHMKARPLLDHVQSTKKHAIKKLYLTMLKNIVGDLAK